MGKVTNAILEKFKEKLLARDNDREYLNSQITKLQERVTEQEQQLLKTEILINELKFKNEELNESNDELSKERENFTKEISFMNNTKSSLNGRISKLQLKLNEKEQEILKLEKSAMELRGSLDEKSQKIFNYSDDQQKMNLVVDAKEKDIESLVNKISLLFHLKNVSHTLFISSSQYSDVILNLSSNTLNKTLLSFHSNSIVSALNLSGSLATYAIIYS